MEWRPRGVFYGFQAGRGEHLCTASHMLVSSEDMHGVLIPPPSLPMTVPETDCGLSAAIYVVSVTPIGHSFARSLCISGLTSVRSCNDSTRTAYSGARLHKTQSPGLFHSPFLVCPLSPTRHLSLSMSWAIWSSPSASSYSSFSLTLPRFIGSCPFHSPRLPLPPPPPLHPPQPFQPPLPRLPRRPKTRNQVQSQLVPSTQNAVPPPLEPKTFDANFQICP